MVSDTYSQNQPVPAIRIHFKDISSTDSSIHIPTSKIDSIVHYSITDAKVVTYEGQGITNKSAFCGGEIQSSGGGKIIEIGFCFSTLPNPTINNNRIVSDSLSTNKFTSELVGLLRNKKYYVKAYAINETGVCYGNQVEFTTSKNGETVIQDGYEYLTFVPDHTIDRFGNYRPLTVYQENLKTAKYANGDSIRQVKNFDEMKDAIEKKEGAWCYYNFDPQNDSTFGKLYNVYAVKDNRKLAPLGWHVLRGNEFFQIGSKNQDNYDSTGVRCKAIGTIENGDGFWKKPNLGALNLSGFTGLPGGFAGRFTFGDDYSFGTIQEQGNWWLTNLPYNNLVYFIVTLNYDLASQRSIYGEHNGYDISTWYVSVRCVKDY
jgi:uncharacterized protein (TIGR02145 family)